ncbi:MAG TPA: DUF1800 domain-containing protein [Gemmataceae bacterium]|nr:DUF1800 domain-containing protein [Gemmataceae bacterium]
MTSEAWEIYEPSAADPWDLSKVAHLHRRAGFGATWAELERDRAAGPAASVQRLLLPPPPSDDEEQILDGLRRGAVTERSDERLKAYWLYRILYQADPLREKQTLFWHSHFATSNRKVNSAALMLRQNETLRRYALGEFGVLLNEIARDPAMLLWLDAAGSKKDKPNENLAREFLELFALGVGRYTESDIRQAARAFSGWVRVHDDRFRGVDELRLDAAQTDDGSKTFLKQTGAWKPADIVRITLEQPACAEFLCRKLYRFLVSESAEPAPELIQPLAEELRSHHYAIGHVVGIILRSRHFYTPAVRRQRIKSPVEFSAGLVRALELPRGSVSLLALAMKCDRQGQELFHPPNVKGWDGGKSWLNSTTVLERGNWIADLIWGNPELGLSPYDPLAWAERYQIESSKVPETLIALLLQGEVNENARELILKTGADGQADSLRRALQVVLHCPQFQLS